MPSVELAFFIIILSVTFEQIDKISAKDVDPVQLLPYKRTRRRFDGNGGCGGKRMTRSEQKSPNSERGRGKKLSSGNGHDWLLPLRQSNESVPIHSMRRDYDLRLRTNKKAAALAAALCEMVRLNPYSSFTPSTNAFSLRLRLG